MSAPHTAIRLVESACTSCMLCARECPSWCIEIGSHTEAITPAPTSGAPTSGAPGRSRTVHVLDRFTIDWSVCMFCGICVEVCPFDALEWSDRRLAPGLTLTELVADIPDLG